MFFDVWNGFYWTLCASLPIHFIFYLLYFPRIEDFNDSPEAKKEKIEQSEKKSTFNKSLTNQLKSTKKTLQKEITPKTKPTMGERNNWWVFEDPEKLGLLDLTQHGLSETAESIPKLLKFKNLRHLILNNNYFENIPDEIYLLDKINKLDLSSNQIAHLPSSISMLKNLIILELADNNIKNIPPWIATMPSLKIINLKGNPISAGQINRLKKEAPHLTVEF